MLEEETKIFITRKCRPSPSPFRLGRNFDFFFGIRRALPLPCAAHRPWRASRAAFLLPAPIFAPGAFPFVPTSPPARPSATPGAPVDACTRTCRQGLASTRVAGDAERETTPCHGRGEVMSRAREVNQKETRSRNMEIRSTLYYHVECTRFLRGPPWMFGLES